MSKLLRTLIQDLVDDTGDALDEAETCAVETEDYRVYDMLDTALTALEDALRATDADSN